MHPPHGFMCPCITFDENGTPPPGSFQCTPCNIAFVIVTHGFSSSDYSHSSSVGQLTYKSCHKLFKEKGRVCLANDIIRGDERVALQLL